MLSYALGIRCERPTQLLVSILLFSFFSENHLLIDLGDWSSFCWDKLVLDRSILSLDVSAMKLKGIPNTDN